MVERVPKEETANYGIIDPIGLDKDLLPGGSIPIKDMVEKPNPADAPSNLAVVGRYVLTGDIWTLFKQTPIGAGGEIQLTDTLRLLLKNSQINAYCLKGKSHDCGSKLGYMKANTEYALRHPVLGKEYQEYLKNEILPKLK